jgi:hypothetical protein
MKKLLIFTVTLAFIISCSNDSKKNEIVIPEKLCGNGIINEGEQCEDATGIDSTCTELGFWRGNIACSHLCLIQNSCTNDTYFHYWEILGDTHQDNHGNVYEALTIPNDNYYYYQGKVRIIPPNGNEPHTMNVLSAFEVRLFGIYADDDGNFVLSGRNNKYFVLTLEDKVGFISYHSSSGNYVWFQRLFFNQGRIGEVSINGNSIYAIGYGNFEYNGNREGGEPYISIVKLNKSDGSVIWKKNSELGNGSNLSLKVDENENIYVSGSKDTNGIIIKFDKDGNELNRSVIDGPSTSISSIYFSNNNLYAVGNTKGIVDQTITNKDPAIQDVFVAKYDQNLNILWTKQIIDSSNADSVDVKHFSDGKIHLISNQNGNLTYYRLSDSGTIETTIPANFEYDTDENYIYNGVRINEQNGFALLSFYSYFINDNFQMDYEFSGIGVVPAE